MGGFCIGGCEHTHSLEERGSRASSSVTGRQIVAPHNIAVKMSYFITQYPQGFIALQAAGIDPMEEGCVCVWSSPQPSLTRA